MTKTAMNKNLKALVFMYEGDAVSSELVANIGTAINAECKGKNISVYSYDEKDIANAIIKFATPEEEPKSKPSEYNPEENAVIYIGTLFQNVLGQSYKTETFVSALTQKISEARYASDEDSKAFMHALWVLSQEDLHISQALLRKYRMNESKILIIKRIYNIVTSVR